MPNVTIRNGGDSVNRDYNTVGDIRRDNGLAAFLAIDFGDVRISVNNDDSDASDDTSLIAGDTVNIRPRTHTKG
jgi:hypothetical protein